MVLEVVAVEEEMEEAMMVNKKDTFSYFVVLGLVSETASVIYYSIILNKSVPSTILSAQGMVI